MDNNSKTSAFITDFFKALSNRDFDTLGQFFSDDSIYWVSGDSSIPSAGEKAASERIPQLHDWFWAFDSVEFRIINTVVQDRKAVVEFKVHGRTTDGLEYSNDVVMSFELSLDSKVVVLREYLDWTPALAFIEAQENNEKKIQS